MPEKTFTVHHRDQKKVKEESHYEKVERLIKQVKSETDPAKLEQAKSDLMMARLHPMRGADPLVSSHPKHPANVAKKELEYAKRHASRRERAKAALEPTQEEKNQAEWAEQTKAVINRKS